MGLVRKIKRRYYFVVYNRNGDDRFYFKNIRKARKLLGLMEESLFYGDGNDWGIRQEPVE